MRNILKKNTIHIMIKNSILLVLIVILFIRCNDELPPLPRVNDVCSVMNDSVFRKYCYKNFDSNKDGKVSMDEAKYVRSILVHNMRVRSLQGIEYFLSLDSLDCSQNQILTLDITRCTELTHLDCSVNMLFSVDLNRCLKLKTLNCGGNQLTSLNVSKCTSLVTLNCAGIYRLNTLDVSKSRTLKYLCCNNDHLSSLNVSECPALETLICENNLLTELNISTCKAVGSLNCKNNLLTSLITDKNINVALSVLDCSENKLSTLDVTNFIGFYVIRCNNNLLTSLDVSKCTILGFLYCYNNPNLTTLWLKTNYRPWLYKDSFTIVQYKN